MAQRQELEVKVQAFINALETRDEAAVKLTFANLVTFVGIDLMVNIGRMADAFEKIANEKSK